MNKKIRTTCFLLLLLGYVFFFGYSVDQEAVWVPVWVLYRDSVPLRQEPGEDLVPFVQSDEFGYLDPAGSVYHREGVLYGAAVHASGFINYSRLSDSLVLRSPRGDILETLDARGYPLFLDDRLLVFAADRQRISEYDFAGEPVWTRSFDSLITSAAAGNGFLLVGFLNGTLVLLSHDGGEVYSVQPVGSRVRIIYGCALTPTGDRLAAVAGLDPQKLIFLEKKNGSYRIEEKHTFPEPVRSSVHMAFTDDGEHLLFSAGNRTFLYSCVGERIDELGSHSVLTGVSLEEAGKLSAFLFAGEAESTLTVLEIDGAFQESLSLPGNGNFLARRGQSFFIGFGSDILRFDLEVR